MSRQLIDRIDAQFVRLEELVKRGEDFLRKRSDRVSGWSIGQQIDHITKANGAILAGVAAGKEQPPGPTISFAGRIVLLTGFIPRGVGKSPERYIGVEVSASELSAAIASCREAARALEASPERLDSSALVIKHPRFGLLTASQALHFAKIHAAHHIKIIQDIEDATRQPGA